MAESMEGAGMPAESMFCYLSIIRKYPSDYLSVAKLGSIFNTMKDYEGAITLTEAYRRTDSTNVEVNRQNALAYCLRKEYPTAIKRYQDLTARGDSTLLTCYYLGVSYYATKEYYKARVTRRQPTLLFGTFVLQDIMETRGNRISEPGYRPDYPRRQYHGALILRLGRLLQANQANPGPNQGYQRTIQICP